MKIAFLVFFVFKYKENKNIIYEVLVSFENTLFFFSQD